MEQINWISIIIGIIVGVGGFALAYFSFIRTRKKDDMADGASVAVITSDIGYVKSGIEGINQKLEKQDERHIQVVERLCNAEMKIDSAHKRIDEVIETIQEK